MTLHPFELDAFATLVLSQRSPLHRSATEPTSKLSLVLIQRRSCNIWRFPPPLNERLGADVPTSVAMARSPELSERVGGGRERYLPRKALLYECVVLSIWIAGVAALER
jgi:hypothetical protein